MLHSEGSAELPSIDDDTALSTAGTWAPSTYVLNTICNTSCALCSPTLKPEEGMWTAEVVSWQMEGLDVFSAFTHFSGSSRVSLRSSVCVCCVTTHFPGLRKALSATQRFHFDYAKGKDVTTSSKTSWRSFSNLEQTYTQSSINIHRYTSHKGWHFFRFADRTVYYSHLKPYYHKYMHQYIPNENKYFTYSALNSLSDYKHWVYPGKFNVRLRCVEIKCCSLPSKMRFIPGIPRYLREVLAR